MISPFVLTQNGHPSVSPLEGRSQVSIEAVQRIKLCHPFGISHSKIVFCSLLSIEKRLRKRIFKLIPRPDGDGKLCEQKYSATKQQQRPAEARCCFAIGVVAFETNL